MKARYLAAVIAISLVSFLCWKGIEFHDGRVLAAREFDPNPIKAKSVRGIRPVLSLPVPFQRIMVDSRIARNGRKPKVFINPDGRETVVGAQLGQAGFALYPPGRPAVLITPYSRGTGAEDAQSADIDGDGAPDIVVGGLDDKTYVLHNPLHDAGCSDVYRCSWDIRMIDKSHASHDVVVGDVDHNGRIDVATENGIYFNDGKGEPGKGQRWTFVRRDVIARDGQGTSLADLEGDGILDVVAPYHGTILARFVNPLHHHGDPLHERWKVQAIDAHPLFSGNMTTAIADVNHDGRNDVILAPMYGGGGLVWYEAPAVAGGAWHRHLIDKTVNFVHQGSLQPADFNGNGSPDIAFAEQDQSPTHRVGVFYNVNGDGSKWRLQVLSAGGGHNIKVGLLGTDKRPSILSALHGYFGARNPLLLWRDVRAAGVQ